jgi:hypothetical protein
MEKEFDKLFMEMCFSHKSFSHSSMLMSKMLLSGHSLTTGIWLKQKIALPQSVGCSINLKSRSKQMSTKSGGEAVVVVVVGGASVNSHVSRSPGRQLKKFHLK